jgi:Xaa-Pro aminopeptidase
MSLMASSSSFAGRMKALRALLRARDLDAFVTRNLVHVRYLCGFVGTAGALVVDRRGATFFTDGRYEEAAHHEVQAAKVCITPMTGLDGWFQTWFRKAGYATLGYETSLTVAQFGELRRQMRGAGTRLEQTEGLVESLRLRKDADEIKRIARAARIADAMMEAAWEGLRPGVTEREVSRYLRTMVEELGGEGESFANIVAFGPNSARPHHHPGKMRLRNGHMVTVDLGAVFGGYCSDMTRNPCVGKVTSQFEKMYAACLEAQSAAVKAVRAGRACREVDAIARDLIASRGYGKHFNHGTGHGVGLEIHEGPRLNLTSEAVLEEGMVVTVEPGVYIPGVGGVRIEDLVVVTAGAPRVLSRTPKDLVVLDASS